MLIAVSPMLYASVISAFGQQRVRNTSSGNIRQGTLGPRYAYGTCNVWLAEQRSPASPRTLSLVPPPLSLLACCKIRTNPHLCRTWLAGTASRPVARETQWTPVAVALGPGPNPPRGPKSPFEAHPWKRRPQLGTLHQYLHKCVVTHARERAKYGFAQGIEGLPPPVQPLNAAARRIAWSRWLAGALRAH